MKRIFLAIATIVCSVSAYTQVDAGGYNSNNIFVQQTSTVELYSERQKEPETLIDNKIHSSGYGALSTQYSKFNHQDALFLELMAAG